MKKFAQKFLFIVFTLTIVSCERDANVKLPDSAPKPVLVCFISPQDSIIRIKLTNSRPLYSSQNGNFPSIINNAEIKISHNGNSAIVPFINDSLGYQLQTNFFEILEGEKYFLEVSIPDGRKLSSSTIVPMRKPTNIKYKVERFVNDSTEFYIDVRYKIEMSWTDIPTEKNTYRALVYAINTTKDSADTTVMNYLETFKTDELGDGNTISINTEIFAGYSNDTISIDSPIYLGALVYLIVGNNDYIKYHKDLNRFQDANPFSEPTINFSNINGGIGCFGAYLMDKKRL